MFDSIKKRLFTTGVLATGNWIFYRVAQCVMTLDVSRLVWLDGSKAHFKKPTDSGLDFRFLTPEEIRAFSVDPENLLDESLADRLKKGQHYCFAALSTELSGEQRLAAYAWFSLHSVEAKCNQGKQKNTGVDLSYPDHVAFMYKGFTHPAFRGRGLYGMVNGLAIQGLADQGITHLLSTMDWTNVAARRSCRRLGFSELGLLCRWGWGDWMHTKAPRTARPLGIQIGKKTAMADCATREKPNRKRSRSRHRSSCCGQEAT